MSMLLRHRWWVLCLLAVGAVAAHGQAASPAACPWLTQGTAERVLGGEVTVDVYVSEAGEGVCSFVRVTETMTSLRIEVSKSILPACGADAAKLKGIGNEALRCAVPTAADHVTEKIGGRVRDRYFTLAMSHPGSSVANQSAEFQDDALEQAAESVAGNLF